MIHSVQRGLIPASTSFQCFFNIPFSKSYSVDGLVTHKSPLMMGAAQGPKIFDILCLFVSLAHLPVDWNLETSKKRGCSHTTDTIPKPLMYQEFFWADWYTHRTHKGAIEIFKVCASRYPKYAFPDWLFSDFIVKHFPDYTMLHCKKLFFVDDF